MPIEVKMGAISPTMSSGQIVEWKVKVGDKVKEGDVIADVQTDKAVMPLESFDEGIVARYLVEPGAEIPVGQTVMVLAKKGEDPKAVAAQFASGADSTTVSAPRREESKGAAAGSNGQDRSVAPAEVAVTATPVGGRVRSSPLARKVALAEKVDIAAVTGTGPSGRVVRRDVEAFLAERTSAKPAVATSRAIAAAPIADERIPLTRIRATIAQRMAESKRVAPDIHVTVDIRVDRVVEIREKLNKQLASENVKLSVGDFVTKAVALALRRHPGMNASFDGDAIIRHGSVNLGIAVALDGGLIVPVLKNVDTLGLREIRLRSQVLYDAAREMKLTSDQMTGGTFTISNLGMYGVREFDAILNLPQVGILAVGAAEKRPVVEGDSLAIGTVMSVTLTADHRAADGALAAEFLRTLRNLLEEPGLMLL